MFANVNDDVVVWFHPVYEKELEKRLATNKESTDGNTLFLRKVVSSTASTSHTASISKRSEAQKRKKI